MKIILSFLVAAIAFSSTSFAQGNAKQRKSPHDTIATSKISVTYGRPYKKDRVIFGGLEKYGNVWRVGADEATQVTFKQDMKFGGASVKKGTYAMFAIPEEKEWTIILNSQLGQWGAFSYEKFKDKDALKVKVPVKNLSAPVEQLTIKVNNADLSIEWDQVHVSVPLGK